MKHTKNILLLCLLTTAPLQAAEQSSWTSRISSFFWNAQQKSLTTPAIITLSIVGVAALGYGWLKLLQALHIRENKRIDAIIASNDINEVVRFLAPHMHDNWYYKNLLERITERTIISNNPMMFRNLMEKYGKWQGVFGSSYSALNFVDFYLLAAERNCHDIAEICLRYFKNGDITWEQFLANALIERWEEFDSAQRKKISETDKKVFDCFIKHDMAYILVTALLRCAITKEDEDNYINAISDIITRYNQRSDDIVSSLEASPFSFYQQEAKIIEKLRKFYADDHDGGF